MPLPIRVLHVVPRLLRGGVTRALLAAAAHADVVSQTILSLAPALPGALTLAARAGIPVVETPPGPERDRLVAHADIVHVHFWNTREIVDWCRTLAQPARVLLLSHVFGDTPPYLLPPAVIAWADRAIGCGPGCPGLSDFVLMSSDLSRLAGVAPRPHDRFTVAYIGTVEPVKMHPSFVRMSAAVDVPDVRVVVCGSGGGFAALAREADALGASSRFEFRGYVEDIGSVLAECDVFGYPTIHGYAAAELVVQEAMYAGVPPVVFRDTMCDGIVDDGRTGLVVSSEAEYVAAIERLHRDASLRRRLGAEAAAHARRAFSPAAAGAALAKIYAELLAQPKRTREWPFAPPAGPSAGAWTLVDLLGDAAPPFLASLTSTDDRELIAAESSIAASPPLIVDGIRQYRSASAGDPHLSLWSGLVLRAEGRPALAAAEFERARTFGLAHWRVSWYLAEAALTAGAADLARDALVRVRRAAPGFAPAEAALAALGGVH